MSRMLNPRASVVQVAPARETGRVAERPMRAAVPVRAWRRIETALGTLVLEEHSDGAIRTWWTHLDDDLARTAHDERLHDGRLLERLARRLVRAVKPGAAPDDFSDLDLPPGPSFFRRCWSAAQRIPRGTTVSYGELARAAGGTPAAARAAGQAMRHNPVPIIVPCHRVLGAGGALGGFAGTTDGDSPALRLKRALLEIERG